MNATSERRFLFTYGERRDIAELVILPPGQWTHESGPAIQMVAHLDDLNGTLPHTLEGKQMLRAAEAKTGLRLAFRAKPWVMDGDTAARPVVLVGDNALLIAALVPVAGLA